MLAEALHKVICKENLSRMEAFSAMQAIMEGTATPSQIGAFLTALRMKGEVVEEIAGFAACMRSKVSRVDLNGAAGAVDLVGTGGDGKHTFNISTVAALVVAGAGVPVAKHGNRSVSSKCGSADLLAALGVNIELNANQLSSCLRETGIAFLYAPCLHPAMRHVAQPRRELGVRTVFNILGPITNPAGVRRQLIGVYDRSLGRLLAEVLAKLEAEHVMLVHSADGMDEISLEVPTHIIELKNGVIQEKMVEAKDFGLPRWVGGVLGGDALENARIALSILQGDPGPAADTVIANAAAALVVAGAAADLAAGAKMASHSLSSGAALEKLQALRRFTNRAALATVPAGGGRS